MKGKNADRNATEASRAARARYDKKHFTYVSIKIKREDKERLKQAADACGESVNKYILTSVEMRLKKP